MAATSEPTPTVPQLRKLLRFIARSPLFRDFAFLLLQRFHGDSPGGAPVGAQPATNALLFVLDDGSRLPRLQFCRSNTVALLDQRVVTFVAAHLHKIDKAQAVLRTHIDAAVA